MAQHQLKNEERLSGNMAGRFVLNAVQRPPLELAIGERRDAEADDLRSNGQLDVEIVMHNHLTVLATQHNACQR
jgi:hypothetical protein